MTVKLKKEEEMVSPPLIQKNIRKFHIRIYVSLTIVGFGWLFIILMVGIYEPSYLNSPSFFIPYGLMTLSLFLVCLLTVLNNRTIESWIKLFIELGKWEKKIESIHTKELND